MPPLSTQEQDDQQCNDEAENCSTFCQSSAQQQVGLDLAGCFGLAADGLRCLTGRNADADAAANTSQRCDASAQSYESVPCYRFSEKVLQCAKKSRRPRRPRPTSSFAHALPGAFYVTYHSTIVPNFVAPGPTFYVLLYSISQRPKKCCVFCTNFRSYLMPIAQFPSGSSSFRFVFRVKNGAKSAHYSPFVYPVYQIYIGGPAAMQPQTRL